MIGTMLFTSALFILFYIAAAVSLFWDSRRKAVLENDLLQHGIHVIGYIAEDVAPYKRSTLLSYHYEYEGKKRVGKQMVSKRAKNTLRRGKSVSILFLADNPRATMIESNDPRIRESRVLRRAGYRSMLYLCVFIPLFIVLLMSLH